MKKKQAIKDIALRYRPREKVKHSGIKALSNYELLALIIGSGQKKCNVLELAKKVEKKLFSQNSNHYDELKLSKIFGIGEVLESKILASLEFGQRLANQKKPNLINHPSKIFSLAIDIANKKQEYCLAFYLNGRDELLSKKILAIGGLNYNFMEARDIFEPAFLKGASSFILTHNHPSGNPNPSEEDLMLTQKIAKLGDLLGVKLLDHLVVSKNKYFSIKEHFAELFEV